MLKIYIPQFFCYVPYKMVSKFKTCCMKNTHFHTLICLNKTFLKVKKFKTTITWQAEQSITTSSSKSMTPPGVSILWKGSQPPKTWTNTKVASLLWSVTHLFYGFWIHSPQTKTHFTPITYTIIMGHKQWPLEDLEELFFSWGRIAKIVVFC